MKQDKAHQSDLSSALEKGTQPYISEQRIDANRWQVRQKLRAYQAKKRAPLLLIPQFLLANKSAIFAMSLTFVFGYAMALFNPNASLNQSIIDASQAMNQQISYPQMQHDSQIVDLKINQSMDGQANTGEMITVDYTTVTHSQLDTLVSDEKTLRILSLAMQQDLPDETRLQLADLLNNHLDRSNVIESLSYSLLNDPNPGVRMLVAESLAKLSSQQEVRKVLRFALAKDINAGVRVSVFNGLIQHLDDPQTIVLLKNKSLKDSNPYIRNKSMELIKINSKQSNNSI